jgi:DsbC/DsbD-like thiol-disulfide interchange protein
MKRSALAFLIAFAPTGSAVAQAGPGLHAEVDVLPGWRTADGTHMAALRITLDEGWKTYWRAPGEAGIPPHFNWSGSENLGAVGFLWPVPQIIVSNGVTTLGYAGEVILPIEVTAADPGADIAIEGALAFGICEDVCMPLEARVSAVLPAAAADQDPRIIAALAARPVAAGEAAVDSADCTVEPIADGLRVTARIDMPEVGPAEFLVVEAADRSIWVSQAVVRREGNILTAEADLVPPAAKPFDLDTETLRITVLAQGRGVDIQGCDEAD